MSLHLMKERIRQSGVSLYEEQIKDAQDILAYSFTDDVSYHPGVVLYQSDKKIPIKMYDQKYSASYGITAKFLSPHNIPVELGTLLHDTKRDEYWLCVESYDVSGIHWEGKLGKCLRFLKWQDKNREARETPVIVTSASKYNNGENGTDILRLGSDQLMLFAQLNEDTVKLDRGMKFFIDENTLSPSVYEITRMDTALYSYMGKGFISIIVTECAYTPSEEELKYGICGCSEPVLYHKFSGSGEIDEPDVLIKGSPRLKYGHPRTYSASFPENGGWDPAGFRWNVVSDFEVAQDISGDRITLSVEDENLIGLSFLLQIIYIDKTVSEIEITIIE